MVLGRTTRGRHTDNPSGCHSIQTNQQSTSINPPVLHRMPFLSQPSNLSSLGTGTGICWIAYPCGLVHYRNSNSAYYHHLFLIWQIVEYSSRYVESTRVTNNLVGAAPVTTFTFEPLFTNKIPLHVWRHVELQRKREMRVDLFFHHRQHVEGVSHCVEAENHWQLLETCPSSQPTVNHSLVQVIS